MMFLQMSPVSPLVAFVPAAQTTQGIPWALKILGTVSFLQAALRALPFQLLPFKHEQHTGFVNP